MYCAGRDSGPHQTTQTTFPPKSQAIGDRKRQRNSLTHVQTRPRDGRLKYFLEPNRTRSINVRTKGGPNLSSTHIRPGLR